MDSEYLKSTVGPALTAAMSALVVEQPSDSVEVSGFPTDPTPVGGHLEYVGVLSCQI